MSVDVSSLLKHSPSSTGTAGSACVVSPTSLLRNRCIDSLAFDTDLSDISRNRRIALRLVAGVACLRRLRYCICSMAIGGLHLEAHIALLQADDDSSSADPSVLMCACKNPRTCLGTLVLDQSADKTRLSLRRLVGSRAGHLDLCLSCVVSAGSSRGSAVFYKQPR